MIQLRLRRDAPHALQTAARLHWAGWDVAEDGAWLVADHPAATNLTAVRRLVRGLALQGVSARTIRPAGLRVWEPGG